MPVGGIGVSTMNGRISLFSAALLLVLFSVMFRNALNHIYWFNGFADAVSFG